MKTKLKNKWEEVQLGEIGSFLRGPFGSSIKKSVCLKKSAGVYKLYEQGNVIRNDFKRGEYYLDEKIFEQLKKFEIISGDILITCAGTLGKIAIVPEKIEKGIFNSVLMRIRLDNKRVNSKYFVYFFRSSLIQNMINTNSQGVAIKNLFATKELRNFKFYLPPILTQQKIVSIIEKAEKLKELRINADKLTKDYSKAIFLEMLEKIKCKEVLLKDITVDEYTISYGIVQPGDDVSDGLPIIRPVDIINNEIDFSKIKKIKPEIEKNYKKTRLSGGEIVIVVRGDPGSAVLTDSKVKGYNVTRGLAVVKIDSKKINPRYLLEFLKSQKAQNYIKLFTKGATLRQINLEDLRNLPIPIPSKSFQENFAKISNKIEIIKEQQRQSRMQIHNLFNHLMQKSFKGEIIC